MEQALQVTYRQTADLIPYVNNARTHSPEQISQIAASIKEFGFNNPILLDGKNGVVAGHGRLLAAQKLGLAQVPCIDLTFATDAQKKAYILADNKIAENSEWDDELLKIELEELQDEIELKDLGFSDIELKDLLKYDIDGHYDEGEDGALYKKFIMPPFSIIDLDNAQMRRRVKFWEDKGIGSNKGRDTELIGRNVMATIGGGTSIFNPAVAELLISWYSPKGATILDPFAGGSVRGIVASVLGRQYVGNDLRPEQIEENRKQAEEICGEPFPVWTIGDSKHIKELAKGIEADYLFSCPPYADLEVYSDRPEDISNMPYPAFLDAYREIIKNSCEMLKDDRFACFVVSEVRDKQGIYRGLVSDTIKAFEDAGLKYYNEIILKNTVGTLYLRAPKIFKTSRKIGRMHQNILVFVKGDPKRAAEYCGPVDVQEIPDEEGQESA